MPLSEIGSQIHTVPTYTIHTWSMDTYRTHKAPVHLYVVKNARARKDRPIYFAEQLRTLGDYTGLKYHEFVLAPPRHDVHSTSGRYLNDEWWETSEREAALSERLYKQTPLPASRIARSFHRVQFVLSLCPLPSIRKFLSWTSFEVPRTTMEKSF